MNELHDLGFFEAKVGGHVFKMRRRTTALMLQIGDPVRVFGLLAQGRSKEGTQKQQEDGMAAHFKALVGMEEKVCPVALVEIDGVPFVAEDGDTWPELDPVKGLLLQRFIRSGLEVDPISDS